jgi:hypothetical protein
VTCQCHHSLWPLKSARRVRPRAPGNQSTHLKSRAHPTLGGNNLQQQVDGPPLFLFILFLITTHTMSRSPHRPRRSTLSTRTLGIRGRVRPGQAPRSRQGSGPRWAAAATGIKINLTALQRAREVAALIQPMGLWTMMTGAMMAGIPRRTGR